MASSLPTRTGSFIGNGATKLIETIGFEPKSVSFVNLTTGARGEWLDSMDAATVVTSDSGTDAVDAANGLTPTLEGFSLGANAVVNASGEEIHYCARG